TAQIRKHAEEQVVLAEERSKREAAEESNRRLSFLARAGAIVTKSLDRHVTIESILRLLVPEHAEQAVLAELDADGRWNGIWGKRFEETTTRHGAAGLTDFPDAWRQALAGAVVCERIDGFVRAIENSSPQPAYLLALPLRDRDQVFAVL